MDFRYSIWPSIFLSWIRKPNPKETQWSIRHQMAEPGSRVFGPQVAAHTSALWLTHLSRRMAESAQHRRESMLTPTTHRLQPPANAEGLSAGILEPPSPQLIHSQHRSQTTGRGQSFLPPWRMAGKSLWRRSRQMKWNKDARASLMRSGDAQEGLPHQPWPLLIQ